MIRIAILVLVLFAGSASAADMTVFGLPLGAPLTVSECERHKFSPYPYIPSMSGPCFERVTGNPYFWIKYPPSQSPKLAFLGAVVATVIDGNLEGVHFSTMGNRNGDIVFAELVKKYGEPTTLERRPVQTRAGAKLETINAEWKLDDLRVTFEETTDRIDRGMVMIHTMKGASALDAHRQQVTRDRRPL